MRDQPWEDCDNPELMGELIGFNDKFPYELQTETVPTFAKAS